MSILKKSVLSIRLEIEYHHKIEEIIKKTGEPKALFFRRIIDNAYRISVMNDYTMEQLNKNMVRLLELNIDERINTLNDKTDSIIGFLQEINFKLFSGLATTVKKIFKAIYYLRGLFFYYNKIELDEDALRSINHESEKLTDGSFSKFYQAFNSNDIENIKKFIKNV
jgi:predicted DNA-binding protein